MPRKPRKKSKTAIYHIMLRGINKQTIFEDDNDKHKFLETLAKYKVISCFELYGYCLMDNHVHLLMMETKEPISTIMKRISSSYVYWYNRKYHRCGHLFQERFKSESVESARYFITVLRYIHQNPLRAGLVESVFDCKWTSIHEYLHKVHITDIDRALNLFSSDRSIAMEQFLSHTQKENTDQCFESNQKWRLSDDQVREILRTRGVNSNSMLQQMDRESRYAVLAHLKKLEGVSIRQISRITGVSKSIIERIK
ncbi:transposase [Evansella cellulosilytica]|uniref:Transposase IS200-like domain-containing protein n=1 Tax=Evansella cellulosilytica (strain ATCC 21833 / DSM 2522 / FERM P-1141 / JCM 9156 / N-4) TaxID=649639 RepID=E6TUX3_EVAC2|nr:transposase [Evansella cellulosilytica]ADU32125.1 hypothetical protein Bcell_3886 [Evansella cellulosilytica DSM 2522]